LAALISAQGNVYAAAPFAQDGEGQGGKVRESRLKA
jgi:hypothetical protein